MQETDSWLSSYGKDHQDMNCPSIYWVSVGTLVIATVGMLWSLPVPAEFTEISPALNWGSAFLMAAVVYYFILSMALAIGMLPIVLLIAVSQIWLADTSWSAQKVSAGLFLVSLVGLYLGHARKRGISAVIRDIQLMMIAPVWLLSALYRRLGIPY